MKRLSCAITARRNETLTTDDYRYVTDKPCKIPVWGKELALKKLKTKTTITITSSYFAPSMEWSTGMLVGIRSIWHIDDDQMKAKIVGMKNWTAEEDRWYEDHGGNSVSAGHKAVLSSFLMARWSKGKLRGRITDTL